ncbi:DJ-1/PfpI family protein [Stigmatella erecta]|uniref:DJ-1/PfpI family protein n=1 Tax=Stigmatella erecta TaxID=83460 RepID=A0A1I0JVW3_9BACT|nr:DJ-1/PfpI family protein [Stigmatella erecta]SEU14058.1 DJ-1/PfpI family protein [Stigmatella erecta]
MADFPPTQRIGIFIFDGFEPLDVWGFTEAFTIARYLGQATGDQPPYPFQVVFIAKELKPVRSSLNGPQAMPDLDTAQAAKEHFDVLMVPGGIGTRKLVDDPGTLDFLKAMDAKVGIMASVCTGAALLAKLNLLDGKPAATNHAAFGWVSKQGPRVLWDNVSRWVDAGHYVTSAGVSAGTDMAFYLVSRLAGRAVAEMAAKAAEYDWHRDPGQPISYPQQARVG